MNTTDTSGSVPPNSAVAYRRGSERCTSKFSACWIVREIAAWASVLSPEQVCLPPVYQEQPDAAVHDDTQTHSTHVKKRSRRTQRTQTYSTSLVRPTS